MVDPVIVVPFLLFGALLITVIVLVIRHERKRREALVAQAKRLGLAFEQESSETLHQAYAQFGVFNQGSSRRSLNVMRGTYRGVEVRLFEFRYKTQSGSGKDRRETTHYVSVALALLRQNLVRTKIVPENFGHKLWDAIGGDDIDFESDEFSRKFWVKSDDRRAAYDLIHPRMMEFLMAPGWTRWEIVSPGVCLWETGRYKPEHAQIILDRVLGFVERMPTHGGRAPLAVGARA